jgi:hypothetical protein
VKGPGEEHVEPSLTVAIPCDEVHSSLNKLDDILLMYFASGIMSYKPVERRISTCVGEAHAELVADEILNHRSRPVALST